MSNDMLQTETLQAFFEDDGETICIVEDHAKTDQDKNEYVWISVADAQALRDWLNKVLSAPDGHMWRIAQGVADSQAYAKSVLAERGIDFDAEQARANAMANS